MERLDPPVEHLGEAREVAESRTASPRSWQGRRRAAGRDELPLRRTRPVRIHQAGLVGDRQEGNGHRVLRAPTYGHGESGVAASGTLSIATGISGGSAWRLLPSARHRAGRPAPPASDCSAAASRSGRLRAPGTNTEPSLPPLVVPTCSGNAGGGREVRTTRATSAGGVTLELSRARNAAPSPSGASANRVLSSGESEDTNVSMACTRRTEGPEGSRDDRRAVESDLLSHRPDEDHFVVETRRIEFDRAPASSAVQPARSSIDRAVNRVAAKRDARL